MLYFVKIQVVQLCISTDTAGAWMDYCFILSHRSDFNMVDNLSTITNALPMCILKSLSIDEKWLPMNINQSIDLRGLPFNEVATILRKYMSFVLFEFK